MLQRNLGIVHERIEAALLRGGRRGESVTLVAITKTVPAEVVAAAWKLGIRHFGENRVEDAEPKIAQVARLVGDSCGGEACVGLCAAMAGSPGAVAALPRINAPTWHMVGHIQSRKAREVARLFDVIQSVDSIRLIEELEKRAAALHREIPCLLEINTSGEASKYGLAGSQGPDNSEQAAGVIVAAQALASAPHLRPEGLMTLGPLGAPPSEVRLAFGTLRRWWDFLQRNVPEASWRHLSMGMTDDYEIAVEEGATIVRIGRGIFRET